MNPRQRRGVLLIGVSVVGAVAVFLSVSNYVADVRSQVGPAAPVVRLTTDVDAFTPLPPDALEVVTVPERWRPPNALDAVLDVGQRVASTPLPRGTVLQDGMLVEPATIAEGQRELAILVDAETGVAGKIQAGSLVDIIATRENAEGPPSAEIVIEAARIVSVGTPTTTARESVTGAFAEGQVVPVTFSLAPDDLLRLAWIESFATTVRLALRAPLDEQLLEPEQRVYQPVPLPAVDGAGT